MEEVIIDFEGLQVVKCSPGFPEPSYFKVTKDKDVLLVQGTAEDALRTMAVFL